MHSDNTLKLYSIEIITIYAYMYNIITYEWCIYLQVPSKNYMYPIVYDHENCDSLTETCASDRRRQKRINRKE